MTSREEQFRQRLMATFRAEAEEHVQGIVQGMAAMESSMEEGTPVQASQVEPVYRQFHSLKGASQAVGLDEVGRLCQAAESVLATWKADPGKANREEATRILELAVQSAARLEIPLPAGFRPAGGGPGTGLPTSEVPPPPSPSEAPPPVPESPTQLSPPTKTPLPREEAPPVEPASLREPPPAEEPLRQAPGALARPGGETLRIASEKLDSLLRRGEQLVLARLNSRQRWNEARELGHMLEEFRAQGDELERRAGAGSPEGSGREDLRRITAFLHRHIRNLAADHHELDAQLGALLGEVKSARLAPVRPLLEELEMAARRIARQLGKKVRLVVTGGELELDRNIMEALKDPLIHLVRNALDHGLERTEERRDAGKPEEGRLKLGVSSRGTGVMEFRVSDDGRGIQTSEVLEAARRQGLVAEGVEVDSLDLIFSSGLSTRSEVSDLSGRGLGMAIVRERIEALKGTIRVQTHVGEGTTFILSVPTSLATFDGLLVQERGRYLVFPLAGVEAVTRFHSREIRSVEGSQVVQFRGVLAPVSRLGQILDIPALPGEAPSDPTPGVIVSAGGRKAAFLVDEVFGSHEVLSRDLGPQLRRVRYISGACMIGYQQVVPVLNVADLLTFVRGGARSAPSAAAARVPHLLAVDDSITTRTLMRGLLESAGYRVRSAVDGSQAWELLQQEEFDLVVSDVDMPGMTGFDLASRIRNHPRLGRTPVVLVTGQERPEDRQRGLDLGANAYILKSRFDEGILLDTVEKLVGSAKPGGPR